MKPKVQLIIKRDTHGSIRECTIKVSKDGISVERVLTKAILEEWRWDMIKDAIERDPRLAKLTIMNMVNREMDELASAAR